MSGGMQWLSGWFAIRADSIGRAILRVADAYAR